MVDTLTAPMWMIRAGRGAAWLDDFLDQKHVAIGFDGGADLPIGTSREAVAARAEELLPKLRPAQRAVATGQVYRFLSEIQVGDWVCTYDPGLRRYCLGRVQEGDGTRDHVLERWRRVDWTQQVARDGLSAGTRNTLGAILTLFRLSDEARDELLREAVPIGEVAPPARSVGDGSGEGLRAGDAEEVASGEDIDDVVEKAGVLIDDLIVQLDWDAMQELVAGLLRAMGYRTQVAGKGPDRGVDIFASPDGLGLEEPRVFVEVKHRRATMGASDVRSFLGGRQVGDRCLYVSTGGFTREARYEAERSTIPVTLIDLPRLRELVLDYYDRMDPATSALVPLQRIYWPAG